MLGERTLGVSEILVEVQLIYHRQIEVGGDNIAGVQRRKKEQKNFEERFEEVSEKAAVVTTHVSLAIGLFPSIKSWPAFDLHPLILQSINTHFTHMAIF